MLVNVTGLSVFTSGRSTTVSLLKIVEKLKVENNKEPVHNIVPGLILTSSKDKSLCSHASGSRISGKGHQPHRGVPIPDAAMFRKFSTWGVPTPKAAMFRKKVYVKGVGGTPVVPFPLDPPMHASSTAE